MQQRRDEGFFIIYTEICSPLVSACSNGELRASLPPKGDWVATVEGHTYEAMYSEKNYADFCQHFSWGVTWFNQATWSGRHFISWKAARLKHEKISNINSD